MRACLIPGHGPRIDRGAVGRNGETELDYNRELVSMIHAILPDSVVVHRVIERASPVTQINQSGCEIAIEFHLNASDGRATGTEAIFWPHSVKGKKLAEVMQKAAVGALGLKDRGIKEPWAGRGTGFLRGTRMPAIIMESFFIDNLRDVNVGTDRKAELARAYANAIHSLKW